MNINWLLLSWSCGGQSGFLNDFSLVDVYGFLDMVCSLGGTVSLNGEYNNELPCLLQLRSEHINYHVAFGYEDQDNYHVLTLHNRESIGKEINILGDIWNAHEVTHDKNLIKEIFRDIYIAGNYEKYFS